MEVSLFTGIPCIVLNVHNCYDKLMSIKFSNGLIKESVLLRNCEVSYREK